MLRFCCVNLIGNLQELEFVSFHYCHSLWHLRLYYVIIFPFNENRLIILARILQKSLRDVLISLLAESRVFFFRNLCSVIVLFVSLSRLFPADSCSD